jgi:endogenous inhibitor of DNA gyrase (YacG/DUF329 family)
MTPPPLCAYCRHQPVEERWRPFCSERCKLLDLAAWAEGRYRVPGEPVSPPANGADAPDEADC